MMPIAYIEDNRVFDMQGNPYAVYVLPSQSYAFQNRRTKESVISKFIQAISSLTGEYHLYLLSKQLSVPQVMGSMRKNGKHPRWVRHMGIAQKKLEHDRPFHRVNLLVVPLNRKLIHLNLSADNWREWSKEAFRILYRGFEDVRESFNRRLELPGYIDLPEEFLDDVHQQAHDQLIKLRAFDSKARKATLHEIEWWLKKSYFRGVADPQLQLPDPFPTQVIARGGRNVLRPIRTSVQTLSDVVIDEKLTRLIVNHQDDEQSHQSFYVTTNVPQNIRPDTPTGYEWIYGVTEALRFPIDVALHIRVESPKDALENLKGKKKTAEAQYEEWAENEYDVPLELKKDLSTVNVLEMKLRSRQPLLHVRTIFALGANSAQQLKTRETSFNEQAGKFHTLIKSPSDMKRMFQAFYPFGADLPNTWEIPMDPGILGVGVPLGTRELGDPGGFWLGTLKATGKVVFMDPRRPAQELNTASSMMFVGKLGSGKTYTMMLITLVLLSWGAVGYAIDPKGDFARFANIPEIGDEVRTVAFTYDSETTFNPFRLGETKGQSSSSAFGILELILNPKNDETRNIVLGTALENMYKGEQWDMFAFKDQIIKIREDSPEEDHKKEARTIAQRIDILQTDGLGKLLFGRDTGEKLFDRRFFVAITRGLNLPSRGTSKSQWSEGERLSTAMMYAVASLGLKQLMAYPKSQLKVLCLDEVWVLREFDQGRKLYNEALRLSRSENLIVLMGSQNATDFEPRDGEDDISGLFGWKFMYRLDSLKQVESALRILGMTDEDPEDWSKTFSEKYQQGFGLVKDPEGRIGELQVELIDQELDRYFSSTPGKQKESAVV